MLCLTCERSQRWDPASKWAFQFSCQQVPGGVAQDPTDLLPKDQFYSDLKDVRSRFGDVNRMSCTWHLWCAEQLHSKVVLERRLQHLAEQGSAGTPISLRGNKRTHKCPELFSWCHLLIFLTPLALDHKDMWVKKKQTEGFEALRHSRKGLCTKGLWWRVHNILCHQC